MHVKKGDKVVVLTGRDAGKTGEVLLALPKLNRVVVSGANKVKRHMRPTKSGQKGQIIEKEMPMHASNVALSGVRAAKPAKPAAKPAKKAAK